MRFFAFACATLLGAVFASPVPTHVTLSQFRFKIHRQEFQLLGAELHLGKKSISCSGGREPNLSDIIHCDNPDAMLKVTRSGGFGNLHLTKTNSWKIDIRIVNRYIGNDARVVADQVHATHQFSMNDDDTKPFKGQDEHGNGFYILPVVKIPVSSEPLGSLSSVPVLFKNAGPSV